MSLRKGTSAETRTLVLSKLIWASSPNIRSQILPTLFSPAPRIPDKRLLPAQLLILSLLTQWRPPSLARRYESSRHEHAPPSDRLPSPRRNAPFPVRRPAPAKRIMSMQISRAGRTLLPAQRRLSVFVKSTVPESLTEQTRTRQSWTSSIGHYWARTEINCFPRRLSGWQ